MKSAAVLSLVIVAALSMGATVNAQGTQNGTPTPPNSDQAKVISNPAVHRTTAPGDKQVNQREQASNSGCLRETGSLIKARKGHCLPVSGHSYSQEDLKNTGQPDTARALQMLDPRITAHGH